MWAFTGCATGFVLRSGGPGVQAARGGACHRCDGPGGATGPDLSNVAGRFSIKDLAESLIVPSKVISDQYRASVVLTTAGKVLTGRIINANKGTP